MPRSDAQIKIIPYRLKVNLEEVLRWMNDRADPAKAAFKAKKFGIHAKDAIGLYLKDVNELAKYIGKNEALALELFETGIHEARILCSKIYPSKKLTKRLMNKWVKTFDNWETTDSFCMTCFAPSPYAEEMAYTWVKREEEFVRRAGFVLMAAYGFSRKKQGNKVFEKFMDPIKKYATDDRNFVKKANNWALRSIGKRNVDLRNTAIKTAYEILEIDSPAARWIAKDALRELESDQVKMQDYPRVMYRT